MTIMTVCVAPLRIVGDRAEGIRRGGCGAYYRRSGLRPSTPDGTLFLSKQYPQSEFRFGAQLLDFSANGFGLMG